MRLSLPLLLLTGVALLVAYRAADPEGEASTDPEEEASTLHRRGMKEELPYWSSFEVLAAYPHSPTAFVQGLAFDDDGALYESDGLYGQSGVREVEVRTGKTLKWMPQPRHVFGEGLEVIGNKLVQLTWKNNEIYEFRKDSLEASRKVDVDIGREGWGLTADPAGRSIYITDSTDMLFVVEPETYKVLKRFKIADEHLGLKAIHGVNELEWVNGELWGNVYPMYQGRASECIVRIDPSNGRVKGWIDMRGLLAKQDVHVRRAPKNNVLNGIAYHEPTDRLYITGKMWNNMYHVRVKKVEQLSDPARIPSICQLG